MPHDLDLLVIGAGSGGVACSRRAASHGARVAIVEAGRVGGTCVLRGCVPKKLMVYAAAYGDALHEAAAYGWNLDADAVPFDLGRWAVRKTAETTRLEGVYRGLLASAGVQLIEGHARLDGPQAVVIGGRRITAAHIVLATGAAPIRDSVPGIELAATSDELLDLHQLPSRAAVVGGGYIAVEFASVLARLGTEVHLFHRAPLPLRGFDEDLRRRTDEALRRAGVNVHDGEMSNGFEQVDGGLRFTTTAGAVHTVPFVLNATGRRPNSAGLGLETVGIVVDPQGAVPVDAGLRTSAPGVWAIGDLTNRLNLTPVAIAEGRALADALFAGAQAHALDLSQVASAVFTLPPVATIGPSEAMLVASGRPFVVYEADFRPMRQAFIDGTERTYMKLLVDAQTDRVLAVHMIGADAPEIVQSLAVALTAGATKAHFDRTVAVHPTAAEEFVLMRQPTRRHPAVA